jgi:HD-GYP domain-containing protein (c-di-GMP phosphodiesterase class II)
MDVHPHQHPDLELPKDERTKKVSEAFTQLRKGFKTIQMYQLGPERFASLINPALVILTDALTAGPVELQVKPMALQCADTMVWASEGRDSIAGRLFREGIRRLNFLPGLTEDELSKLVQIMLSHPRAGGKDLTAQLFEASFVHIEYLVISGFGFGELSKEQVDSGVARITEHLDQRLQQLGPNSFLPSPLDSAQLAELSQLTQGNVLTLPAFREKVQQEWRADESARMPKQLAVLISSQLEEGQVPEQLLNQIVERLVDMTLDAGNLTSLLEILNGLKAQAEKTGPNSYARQVVRAISRELNLRDRVLRLAELQRTRPFQVPGELVRLLAGLEVEALGSLLEALDLLEKPEQRLPWLEGISHLAKSNPQLLIDSLKSDRPGHAVDVLAVLKQLTPADWPKHVQETLRHPSIAVRIEIVTYLSTLKESQVLRFLAEASRSSVAEVRCAAYEALVTYDSGKAAQHFLHIAQSSQWDKLPQKEKELVYTCLGRTRHELARQHFQEVLAQKERLLGDAVIVSTKLLTVIGLKAMEDPDAQKMLRAAMDAAQTGRKVRSAIAESLEAIRVGIQGRQRHASTIATVSTVKQVNEVVAPAESAAEASLLSGELSERELSSQTTDQQLQGPFRNLLGSLNMLLRSSRLYDPGNAIFTKPLQTALDASNQIIATDGALELVLVSGSFFINGRLVRIDQAMSDQVNHLSEELKQRNLVGFRASAVLRIDDWQALLMVLRTEDGAAPTSATGVHLIRGDTLAEHLEKAGISAAAKDERPEDALRRILVPYARALLFIETYLAGLRSGGKMGQINAERITENLVDASYVLGPRMLGLTFSEHGDHNLVYHLVNTALLSIFFGRELGLNKAQLKQLALVALLCEAPFGLLAPQIQLVAFPERLSAEAQAQIAMARKKGAVFALIEQPTNDNNLKRALCCLQLHAVFDRRSLYLARILALCATFERVTGPCADHPGVTPQVAIDGMCKQLRARFDPELLYVFASSVGTLPFKCLSKPGSIGSNPTLTAP